MNFLDIYLFSDIRIHLFAKLHNADKFILNLVCKLTYTGVHKTNYIKYVCKHNYINLLKYVIEMGNLKFDYFKLWKYAIKYAQLDILNMGLNAVSDEFLLGEYAAYYGHNDVLSLFYSQNLIDKSNTSICASSAKGGKLETLKWLRRNNYEWDHLTLQYAIYSGSIDMVKWVIKWGLRSTSAWKVAAINNRIEIMQLLRDSNVTFTNPSIFASQFGNYEVLAWMQKHGYGINQKIEWYITHHGIHITLDQLIDKNAKHNRTKLYKDEKLTQTQKEQKMINTLDWLKNTNYNWTYNIHNHAIYMGNISIINWFNDNLKFLVWDEEGTQWARQEETLDWIITNKGYIWDERLTNNLAKYGEHKLMEWAILRGCPTDIWATTHKMMYKFTNLFETKKKLNKL